MEQDYLEFLHITKNFPGVTALDDVSMSVHRGEIHALVGENGAGKSTLMNILGGNLQPNGGELRLDGHPVKISSPIDAYRKGIGFVHQESNLLENLSVCENVFLGRERVLSLGRTDRKGMCREIRECCQRLGYQLEPERPVAELNLAERQSVEIVRALLGSPRVLILDEPTAALAEDEVARLFRIVRELRQEGVSVLYISHRLDEIMELADRVTVLKDGKLVGLTPREQPPKPEPEPDLTPQFRTAMLSYAATSTAIPDSYALDMSDLFPTWAAVLADGEELPEGRVLNDAGTADDPIPWVYGMDCHAGKCYRYNGKVYQVAEGGDMIPCTWPPDTPGMWQWEEVQA